jgi:hypothetical protein
MAGVTDLMTAGVLGEGAGISSRQAYGLVFEHYMSTGLDI